MRAGVLVPLLACKQSLAPMRPRRRWMLVPTCPPFFHCVRSRMSPWPPFSGSVTDLPVCLAVIAHGLACLSVLVPPLPPLRRMQFRCLPSSKTQSALAIDRPCMSRPSASGAIPALLVVSSLPCCGCEWIREACPVGYCPSVLLPSAPPSTYPSPRLVPLLSVVHIQPLFLSR